MSTRLSALRSRDFRLLCLGQAISLTGSQMQQVAVVWQLYQVTHHDPLALGSLGLFRVVPVVLFALGGGVLADAMDRRKLMLLAQVGLALSSTTLALATHLHFISAPVIYAAAAFAGAATAFEIPARQALIPELVPRDDLPNALSIYATVWQIGQIGGPALGGALLDWTGVIPIYVIDVLSYLAVIGALLAMAPVVVRRAGAPMGIGAVVEGVRFLIGQPVLLATMILDFAGTFFGGSLLLMPIFADQLLHVGARGLGLLFAAQPIGAALAGGVLSNLPPIRRQGQTVVVMIALYGLAVALFGIAPNFVMAFVGLAISGGADTASMVVRQTIRQLQTPDALRGRLTSLNMIFAVGGPQLGEGEAGFVAKLTTPRISVASGGLVCAAIAVVVGLAMPSLRRYTLPEQKTS